MRDTALSALGSRRRAAGVRAGGHWTRRTVLLAGALAPALHAPGSRAATAIPRLAALDWGLAATAAALGAGPAAVGEMAAYAHWVREPVLPAGTVEIGLRTAPSFETLAALKPDLILVNELNARIRDRLKRIAPTYTSTIYSEGRAPVAQAIAATRELGSRLGLAAQAEALVSHAEGRFEAARQRLAGHAARPVVPLSFIDGRHARVFGAGSLFAGVMERIGLTSGWQQPTNAWGFSVIAIEALAACPDADLLIAEPVPPEARRTLETPGLWSSLLAAEAARAITIPPVWAFGDLTAAARCADVLADALTGSASCLPGRASDG